LVQFAKEILMMAAAPHQYDHDEVHGPTLVRQQQLAAALTERKPLPKSEDVVEVFDKMRAGKSFVDESENVLEGKQGMIETMYVDQEQLDNYGARTVPSRPIEPVDRRDRVGEDTELTDRLEAATQAQSAPEELVEVVEEQVFEERQQKRAAWQSTLSDVKDLLNEDLDI
jgi:hypothetical protein